MIISRFLLEGQTNGHFILLCFFVLSHESNRTSRYREKNTSALSYLGGPEL